MLLLALDGLRDHRDISERSVIWLDRGLWAVGRLRTLRWMGSVPVPGRRKRRCWDCKSSEQTAERSLVGWACLLGVGSWEVLCGLV